MKLPLTECEAMILALMCEGKSTKQIAGDLKRSTRTVEIHRRRIKKKMQAKSLVHLGCIAANMSLR